MASIIDNLESRARVIRRRIEKGHSPRSHSGLEQEIALSSDQIDRTRRIHKHLLDDIRKKEFYIEQDLKRINQYDTATNLKLKRRLLRLDVERRQRVATHQRELDHLHERLSTLLAEHEILEPYNGDSETAF